MAFVFSVNNSILNIGTSVLFYWKEFMKNSAGWEVISSSDGSNYSLSGDIINHELNGNNGMQNSKAWFVIQAPNGKQLLFQCTSFYFSSSYKDSYSLIYISYSKGGYFSGGGSITRPTAVDEKILLANNNGIDGINIFCSNNTNFFTNLKYEIYNNLLLRVHFGADDSNEYGFYIIPYPTNVSNYYIGTCGSFIMEEIVKSDSDPIGFDPVVFYIQTQDNVSAFTRSFSDLGTSFNLNGSANYSSSRIVGYINEGTDFETFGTLSLFYIKSSGDADFDSFPAGMNCSWDKKEYVSAISYGINSVISTSKNGALSNFKGIGKNFLFSGKGREFGDVYEIDNLGYYFKMKDLLFPWPQNEVFFKR